MKKILCILIINIFILSACSANSKNTLSSDNNKINPNISSTDTKTESYDYSNSTAEAEIEQNDYIATNNDKLNPSLDFDNVYLLCKTALKDYHSSQFEHTAINFNNYISNNNLKNYMELRLKCEKRIEPCSASSSIGISKIEWYPDEGYVYIFLNARSKDTQSGGIHDISCEMIVKNYNGKLRIADWYCRSKLSSDTTIRGDFQKINDPNFWENNEKALALIKKMDDLSKQ